MRLNPDDLAALGAGHRAARAERPGARRSQWVADPTLERGSFLVESPTRIVDGRIDAALRQLYERLDHD